MSICAVILVVAFAQPLEAQEGPRRARLSRDVADRLASHVEASTDVIVAAGDTALDQLAVRYGARLQRRITGGAVFEVTGGQLEALSQDADVAHLAGDVPVQRMGCARAWSRRWTSRRVHMHRFTTNTATGRMWPASSPAAMLTATAGWRPTRR